MDEDEEYSDTRNQLLKRFRDSLTKPMSERYFDLTDLIEVFDYAGDLNDDYLRMEALMCGARFYPDSEELMERRGIFYSQYSQNAQEQFVRDNPEEGSFILELIKLRNSEISADDAAQAMEKLLKKHDCLNDEEVIQFIDACSILNLYPWLKDNYERLKSKAEYPNVFIYETGIIADTNRDNDFCIKLLEELTQNEPFNSYYWMMLARQYAQDEEWEKALSAIDYSLAINPDAYQSLLVKGKLYYAMDKPLADVEELLQKAMDVSDGDLECVKYLASIYASNGDAARGRDLLQNAISHRNPENDIEIIPQLILYQPDNIDQLLDIFFNSTSDNSHIMWSSWAQQLSQQGYPEVAKAVISCYQRQTGIKVPTLFAIEDAFRAQKFEEVLLLIDEYLKSIDASEYNFPPVVAMHLISLVKLGHLDDARELCHFLNENLNITQYKNVGNRLEYTGLHYIIWQIERALDKSDLPIDFTGFNPLLYW